MLVTVCGSVPVSSGVHQRTPGRFGGVLSWSAKPRQPFTVLTISWSAQPRQPFTVLTTSWSAHLQPFTANKLKFITYKHCKIMSNSIKHCRKILHFEWLLAEAIARFQRNQNKISVSENISFFSTVQIKSKHWSHYCTWYARMYFNSENTVQKSISNDFCKPDNLGMVEFHNVLCNIP